MAVLLDKRQILDRVCRRGIEVSGAQFDDWKREDLLPQPTVSEQKRRGRPRLLYPASTVDTVLWLGIHRRFIDGDDVARFWLWMEGFDHIHVDPYAVLVGRIQALWEKAQREGMPSLPDIATVAEQGIPERLRETLLDELDEHMTLPRVTSGSWTQAETGEASIWAALFGVLPPSLLAQDPNAGEYPDEDGVTADAMLTPEAAPWRPTMVALLPQVIEAGQLTRLYRLVTERRFQPEALRVAWQLLTPETLPELWPAFALVSPFPVQGKDKPKDRADFLRLLRYEPFTLLVFAAILTATLEALAAPQFRQPGQEVAGGVT